MLIKSTIRRAFLELRFVRNRGSGPTDLRPPDWHLPCYYQRAARDFEVAVQGVKDEGKSKNACFASWKQLPGLSHTVLLHRRGYDRRASRIESASGTSPYSGRIRPRVWRYISRKRRRPRWRLGHNSRYKCLNNMRAGKYLRGTAFRAAARLVVK